MTPKPEITKAQKRRAVNRLYDAIVNYVEKNGGSVLVVGGIQIQQWPLDGPYNFTVGIKITGRPPVLREAKEPSDDPKSN